MTRPTFRIETVTPELAGRYLEKNAGNRPLSRGTVRNYAAEISRGQWLMNGEAIKFSTTGELVDGQHRLSAVVMARRSIETLVIRGLDPAAFTTIDTGRISNTELLNLVDKHPGLIDVSDAVTRKPLDAQLIAHSTRAYFCYLAEAVDKPLAHAFLAAVARPGPGQVNATKLRERLVQVAAEAIPPSPTVKWIWLLQAWNATVAGTIVHRFSRMPALTDWEPRPRLKS